MPTKIEGLLITIVVLASTAPHFPARGEEMSAVTLCQLLAEPQRFDGRIVRVRGILESEGNAPRTAYFDQLSSTGCPGSAAAETKVQVVSPDSHFLENPPDGYRPDQRSIRRAEKVMEKALASRDPARAFEATVEGVFYRAEMISNHPARHRQYPGYVVLQAIRSLRVAP